MDESLRVKEVLSDIAPDVHFIFTDVAYLTHHVTTVLFPGDTLRECDGDLS